MKKQNKPIAIVGIGCRYPGESSSPDKFWDLLVNKKDAIIDIPKDRWDQRKFYDGDENKLGKIRVKQGGFLKENIKEFDPLFFGVSPVEAESMDPQIRLLLEVAYEALEDSGITTESLKGSKTGVFVGGFTIDNYLTQASLENKHLVNSHTSLGSPLTMLANRISYCFDLKGPSLTIDTACSSSLVATHYACQSIWNGESEMALVGGVNMMLTPQTFVLMSQGKFLSKHGRCKTFDSDAGGYARGEGGGVVVLKSYEQAIKDGDRIYALINGTGVNQDGQTNGITVPNKDSQVALMKQVYSESGVDVKDIHYVEAHGTGTPVGDPLEFGAINEVMSESRDVENKLFVGSVKSNIGHLEAGAGVAGLIKAALCLHNNKVPANLHFNNPNPALNYENSVLRVPTSLENLPDSKESFASVNSFGYGGTNAHVLLKQCSPKVEDDNIELKKDDNIVFPVTAKSKKSLKERVKSYRKHIQNKPDDFPKILSNVSHRRSIHSERLAVYANSTEDLIEKLEAFEEGLMVKGVSQGTASRKKPEIVYVYTGMGPQWWKMGRELMEKEPVFLKAVKECDHYFKVISGWSILDELEKPEETSKVKETNIAQTANFVIQVGLTRLLEHYGIAPNAVVGHSVGEVTSLYISGALSLEDALLVSYHRSRLQHTTAGTGGMLAVGLSEEEIKPILKDYKEVSIAAINSNKAVTLAGNQDSLNRLAEKLAEMEVFNRMLAVEVPYHSPMMDPIKNELLESLESLQGKEASIDLYSTVFGTKISGKEIDNNYWWRNVREPVRFAKALKSLMEDNYKVFIEIGPHPVLKNSMLECSQHSEEFQFFQTLNRKESEELNFYENLAGLFTAGYPLKWERWVDKLDQITLPKYNWEKKHYWVESKVSYENKLGKEGNNFLNYQIESPNKTYRTELNNHFFPFLEDHVVQDTVVFPGTGYVAAAIALHENEIKEKGAFGLENIKFHQMLPLNEKDVEHLYVALDPLSNQFEIHNKKEGEDTSWFKRATGKCIVGAFSNETASLDIKALSEKMDMKMSKEMIYEKLTNSKLQYGPYFRGIETINYNTNELIAKIKGCPDIKEFDNEYFIHPGLLDSCFQTMIVFDKNEGVSVVPVSIGKLICYSSPGTDFTCYTRLKSSSFNSVTADIVICNDAGEVAMRIEDIKCQEIATNSVVSDEFPDNCLYQVNWVEEKVKVEIDLNQNEDKTYLVITEDYESSLTLIEQLNGEVIVLQPGTDLRELGENHYEVNLNDARSIGKLIENRRDSEIELIYFSGTTSDVQVDTITTEECLEYINPLFSLVKYFSEVFPRNLRINLITQGGQVIERENVIQHLGTSVFIGLGRLMSNEFPNWKIRLIDFEAGLNTISKETWRIALAKINKTKRLFEEIAIRKDRVYKKVMGKRDQENQDSLTQKVEFKSYPLELLNPEFSDVESISFQKMERLSPEENEVELLIENSTINFKDYLKVTHKISSEAFEGTNSEDQIGIGCFGTIVKVGKNVTKFKEGDKVWAISKGALKSYTTVNEKLVEICPDGLGNESHIITAYLTAIYCLKDKANLKKGDKVLIHKATEGIGLAAINYAKMIGAEVYATAGNLEKRSYLESLGIKHVFNSENLDFSNEIPKITEGKGVDVVLSSLTGEMLHQSLRVLAPYGTYLEIGKVSAVENVSLPMKIFTKNLSFISVDIDQLSKERPEEISRLFGEVRNYINTGELAPLPTNVFYPNQISKAFTLIEEGNYIGELVINFKDQSIEVEKNNEKLFKADKSYLISGGTKGLGLEIAGWMLNKGAQNLVLLSRSGDKDPKVRSKIDKLRQKGANILVYAVDVADLDGMTNVFSDMKNKLPSLAGIFHGAMVLDDGFLLDMNDDRFRKVLRPKVDGTMVLHQLSKEYDLDNFVMFSSLSSLIGHLGQANYVVANTMLDSFAYLRKSLGLAATTVNLGVLGQAGVISRDENLKEMVMDSGIRSFTNEEVLVALEEIVRTKPTQIGFFNVDWSVFEKSFKSSKSSLFEELIEENVGGNSQLNEEQTANLDVLKTLQLVQQKELVIDVLREELSKILKMSKENIPSDKGVNFLGVDSILSVQLIRAINGKLAVELSPMEFTSGPNLKQLSTVVLEKILDSLVNEESLEKVNTVN
ncbi:SDR family NAD(P)-dependent oxidoreductase [Tenacibaculum halocynthiae]|uniref:SDR family NAD(P)-dependent oxidoreductase n=1 Tax=Tenacibaculum halocynthiae TaxID=1254437 RepID=UPI003D64E54F